MDTIPDPYHNFNIPNFGVDSISDSRHIISAGFADGY